MQAGDILSDKEAQHIERLEGGEVSIKRGDWEEIGPEDYPSAHLLTTITMNGINMHLEAWRIMNGGNQNRQTCLMDGLDVKLEQLQNMMECEFQTVKIGRFDYVLICTPFGT